ncbi:hypothetical protein VTL71DRAFT_5657 [Oculimacula yallundae]|uniref:Uncharacterized protein n=1 Tax=Oculimacula yallundae TaxID=86028 RepID=A0ABR4BY95_9HELO
MLSAQSLAVLGFAAVAQASYGYGNGWNTTSSAEAGYPTSEPVVYTTVTTDIYTTYCPEATTFTQGTKTYTATASETLTITDCPCTYSYPAKPTSYPSVPHSYVAPPPPSYNATYTPVWVTTTEVVKSYTTYCPVPTTIVQNSKTYTVTKATTLTITDCPCTATKTYPGTTTTISVGSTTTYCPVPTTITYGASTYPVVTPGTVTLPIYSTTVVPVTTYPAVPEVPATHPEVPATPVVPYPTASIVTSGYASSSAVATPTGPIQVANGAGVRSVGLGAMVAGLFAMVL